ncbi:MAG TPA: phospholipase D-like domain-containing protein [Fibrobacteria bacterium]|nr:phospholipase D-like domain-containing protein [Fibrobacteria bacterium]
MPNATSFADNDVIQVAWRYPEKIPGCLGFAIYRKPGAPDAAGSWEPLETWVGFVGQSNPAWTKHSSEEWPVQAFEWKDLLAARGSAWSHRIVPLVGEPGKLAPRGDLAVVAGPSTPTPDRGSFKTYFNRGILSTQFLVHQIPPGPDGAPDYKVLTNRIDQPGDPLRQALAGQILEGVELLVKRSSDQGGSCYLALYELNDPELVQILLQAGNLHLILSNAGTNDATNRAARQALHERTGIEIIDRFVPSGHIGHNKFCVQVDAQGHPRAVLLGSTNWTDTGICAQSNNALVAESSDLAAAYMDYWNRLKADTSDGKGAQGPELRAWDASPGAKDLAVDQGTATVWFSPNTPHARHSPPQPDEPTPPDLAEVFGLMEQARQAILFLEFEPGTPSVIDTAARIAKANPELVVRGAVTDPKAAGDFNTVLVHDTDANAEVVAAAAIGDQFSYWQQELLKAGPDAHAIIQDKIVVIDPFSPGCVVVTGSHNQGYRASYDNDENLLIVRGHRPLAEAYAVHVMDVFEHYRFRHEIQTKASGAFSGLETTDAWQDKFFGANTTANRDAKVWFPD